MVCRMSELAVRLLTDSSLGRREHISYVTCLKQLSLVTSNSRGPRMLPTLASACLPACLPVVLQGAIEKLEELHASIPDSWIAGQFTNHANPKSTTRPQGQRYGDRRRARWIFWLQGQGLAAPSQVGHPILIGFRV
jgi:hypothetical protein